MSINRADATAASGPLRFLPWIVGAAGLAAAAALARPALEHWSETAPPAPPAVRATLSLPESLALNVDDRGFGLALSPDGRRIVYPAARNGDAALWLHDLRTGRADAVPGTDDARLPFWSADGRSIGFFSEGRLRMLALDSHTVQDLADAPAPAGAAWLPSGDIIAGLRDGEGLMRYRASDRSWTPWTEIDRGEGESSHQMPVAASDGAHVLFHVAAERGTRAGIWIAPVDRPADRVRLTGSEAQAIVDGNAVLYALDGSLVWQPLDADAHRLLGRPELLATSIGIGSARQLFAAASRDVLVSLEPASGARELVWMDRGGQMLSALAAPVQAWDVRIAPARAGSSRARTAGSVAVTRTDPQLGTLDVWIYDSDRPLPRRISPALDIDDSPVWAPDRSRLAWISSRTTVMIRGSQAVLPEEPLAKLDGRARLWDWGSNGLLVASVRRPSTGDDLVLLDARGRTPPSTYAETPFNETAAAISPDGRWLAYTSDESGRDEIYVDRLPQPGRRIRVTAEGGTGPRWRADGRELVFRRGNTLYAVAMNQAGDRIEAGATVRLFDAGPDVRAYDVSADGERFLLNRPMAGEPAPRVRIVVNWRE